MQIVCQEWEGDAGTHAARNGHWVEEPDLRQFDGEVTEENEFRASPLLFYGRNLRPLKLPLVEVLYAVDYDPWQTSAEVDSFVHDKTHDTGCEDIVLHVGVPALHPVLAWGKGRGGMIVSCHLLPTGARRCSSEHCTWRAHCRYRSRSPELPEWHWQGETWLGGPRRERE